VPEHGALTVHIVSDSVGETADMVARAAISQFEPGKFKIERLPKVSSAVQLRDLVDAHCGPTCIFLYTFADHELRLEMGRIAEERDAHVVDLLGPVIDALSSASHKPPSGEAGAVRRTDRGYYQRIEALEFAVNHDDGRHPENIGEAEVILVGVSRTSKTPLAMYLAFKGFKVANVPLALGVEPPKELFEVESKKVFGLITDVELLSSIRSQRMRELGTYARHYADPEWVDRELEESRQLMRKIGCIVIHTDDRAVEEAAQEIIRYLDR